MIKYCTSNNIRLLVTFKKTVYSTTGKVKVRDFEKKTESDEPRESLVHFIKNRLSVYT
jgi:hypothetical protein